MTQAGILRLILSAGIAVCLQPETMAQTAPESEQMQTQTIKPCGHDIQIINRVEVTQPDAPPCPEPKETPEPRPEPDHPPTHFVVRKDDLVDLPVPASPLRLAEENEVNLVVKAPGLARVRVLQNRKLAGYDGYIEGLGTATSPVLRHPDGSNYIRVVPMGLGQVELTIEGTFVGGFYFEKKVIIQVEAPERKPARLTVGPPSFDPGKMFLFINGHPTTQRVKIFAAYSDVKDPIRIDTPDATFDIRATDNNPPFEIDPSTGIFKLLHSGHALLQTSFGGTAVLTCVSVEENSDAIARGRYYLSHCEELYKPGEEVVKPKPFVRKAPQ
jgi:hypothetical protein